MTTDEVLGSITPRLFTPPLVEGPPGPCGCGCALTEDTTYGFRAARFVEERLGRAPWAWQRWLMIHAGELTPLGIPRFRRLIVTVGRQSGKTRCVEDMTLFWVFDEQQPSILGTSTLTKYAKKPWLSAYRLAKKTPGLAERFEEGRPYGIRTAAGEEHWWTLEGSEYHVAASNAEGGRSMSNTRVIADEFAKQYNYDAYGASYYSMDAFEDAQFWALTTPDPKGVPYKDLRGAALAFMEGEPGDESLALFEWSCPDDADPTDLRALAMANPTLNRPGGKNGARMLREARAAAAKGGQLLETYKQEIMCIQVSDQDAVIDLAAWGRCLNPGDLEAVRDRVAFCFDVAPSLRHCTLYAAAVMPDDRVRVDAVQAWEGVGCVDQAARDLPSLVARAKPRVFGWLPTGPAAAVGARLADRQQPGRRGEWPPRGVTVQEIRGELTQVAMGFSALVAGDKVWHSGDPLLDDHVTGAEKQHIGDAWRFSRKGEGDVDALYAAAGAAHLARTLPASVGKPRILLPRNA
jgi:hypothetical protein